MSAIRHPGARIFILRVSAVDLKHLPIRDAT